MLTARDAVDDRVKGLDAGADDYLTKPFSLAELLARLRALARRGPVQGPAVLEAGDLKLDPAERRVWRGDDEIELSAREFALLETLMRSPGRIFSQAELLEAAWDLGYEQSSNVVEVYVGYLRAKIDRPFGVKSLETVRGMGYRLRRDGGRTEPRADQGAADARVRGGDGAADRGGGALRLRAAAQTTSTRRSTSDSIPRRTAAAVASERSTPAGATPRRRSSRSSTPRARSPPRRAAP